MTSSAIAGRARHSVRAARLQPDGAHGVTRPTVGCAAAFFIALIVGICDCVAQTTKSAYVPPESPRTVYNFNIGWRFLKGDAADAARPEFDDSKWATVSAPHTYNDV